MQSNSLPKGGAIEVASQTLYERDVIEIRVKDTGIGMMQSELDRIFDAFAQGDHAGDGGSHRFGGLGLGLAICQMLVQSHAGRIQAESEGPGEGSCFVIELPLVPEICMTLSVPTEPVATDFTSEKQLEILLVEDHDATRTALASLLKRRRYLVSAAATSEEARLLAREKKFDLLISDIGLPDGNGYDLMSELAVNHGLKGIALTGYGMERDIDRSTAAGFVAHLTKPIQMQSLEGAIQTVLTSAHKQ